MVALPCTARLYSERQAVRVGQYRVMPLLTIRGRPEVRLGGFTSLAGTPLAGFWAPAKIGAPAAAASAQAAEPDTEEDAASVPAQAAEEAEETPAADEPGAEAPSDDDASDDQSGGTDAAADQAPADDGAGDDLDALLAGLDAEPEPAAADETESDLDALLASLN